MGRGKSRFSVYLLSMIVARNTPVWNFKQPLSRQKQVRVECDFIFNETYSMPDRSWKLSIKITKRRP